MRTTLGGRITFGRTTYADEGRPWWGWHQVTVDRLRYQYVLAFAEIASHNHFVLDRGGKVFKQTAPMIKLPAGASEDKTLGLLGLLNSSVACFWLKQVCFNKGNGGIGGGISDEKWELRYAHNATQVAEFPLTEAQPIALAARLDSFAREMTNHAPATLLANTDAPTLTRAGLDVAGEAVARLRGLQIAVQEELDWCCYGLYGLLPAGVNVSSYQHPAPPGVALGARAFEIVLARRVASGAETTAWFERHGSAPVTEIPAHWPEDYRQVVQRRIDLIGRDRCVGLIERPEYKRRWNTPSWRSVEGAALRDWLLARLESRRYWPRLDSRGGAAAPQIMSTSRLADAAAHDAEFMQIAALYAGHADFDLKSLVADLVGAESVPFLPALCYTDAGLRKRAQWADTWALQRREDAGEAVGRISVPPKYQGKDFLKTDFWRLRGSLDVPKERWFSYPGCERGADGSLPIAWAGWDHLQQAMAIATYFIDMKEREGWSPERLQPLLAGLVELLPWLKQWHNDMNPDFGARMGDYYEAFVSDEARALQFTLDDLRAWKPAATAVKRGRKKAA